jgi:hypothetical protein
MKRKKGEYMHYDHNTNYRFFVYSYVNDEDALGILDSIPPGKFKITYEHRQIDEESTRLYIELAFHENDCPGLYTHCYNLAKNCDPLKIHMGLFEQNHDLMAEFGLENWHRVA